MTTLDARLAMYPDGVLCLGCKEFLYSIANWRDHVDTYCRAVVMSVEEEDS